MVVPSDPGKGSKPLPPAALPDFQVELFDEALGQLGLSAQSRRCYMADLRAFAAWARQRGLSELDVTSHDLAAYRDALLVHRSATGVRRAMVALRRFFGHLVVTGQRDSSPATAVKLPHATRHAPEVLSSAEVGRVLEAAAFHGLRRDRPQNQTLVMLLLHTGLRVGELVVLRWPDIDLAAGRLHVRRGNGLASRTVPLNTTVRQALSAWREIVRAQERDLSGPVLSRNGRPLAARTIQRRVALLGTRAGLARHRVHPHAFRHAFASAYLGHHQGDLAGLGALLGHTSITTTAVYTHPRLEDLARKTETLVGEWPGPEVLGDK